MSSPPRCARVAGASRLAVVGLFLALPLTAQSVTVTSLADDGPGSLRDALDAANADGVPTVIDFDPSLAGGTIALASPLPALTEGATTLDADLGGDCQPDIAINGQWLPDANGLAIVSNGNRVAGLAIHSFGGPGGADLLLVTGSLNVIECNFLGTDLAGAMDPPGSITHGAKLYGDNNTLRYNRIIGAQFGVGIHGGVDGVVGPGNEIAFGGTGVVVADGSIGGIPELAGLTPDQVALFESLDFRDDCAYFHEVGQPPVLDDQGHPFTELFALRLTGDLVLDTAGDYLFELPQLDDEARIVVDGVERLMAAGLGPREVLVSGLAVGRHTVEVDFLEGGGAATFQLVVSGPGGIAYETSMVPPSGCPALTAGLCGELFQLREPVERHRITANSIHDNSWLGISLSCCCSPLANDPDDADLGPNTWLNHPVLTGVGALGGGVYRVTGTAPPGSVVELFAGDGDPSGHGEGASYLGAGSAGPGGNVSIDLPLPPGIRLTATAHDDTRGTSEFGPTLSFGGTDLVFLSGVQALPGQSCQLPVFARDSSLSALGVDRPPGERIQGLAYKITFDPAASVASKQLVRAGLTAGLTPLYESAPTTPSTASYVGSFDEATDPLDFTLDAPSPGDQVLALEVTLAADAPAGTITLTLDPATTQLANQAGTLAETVANGQLAVSPGSIEVLSNAAAALRSWAVSSTAIQLAWDDPGRNETGFRLERSTDQGGSWTPVATVGPDDLTYLDDAGLAPATLYHHRLVTLIPADSQISNVAAAATHPAIAAKVCADPVAVPQRSFAVSPSVAWSGSAWGVAWQGREGAIEDEIYFQRREAVTLAPLGPPVRVAASASPADRLRSDRPTLAWSDTGHWGVIWTEGLPGEPGTTLANTTFFALLAADGAVVRSGVRISSATADHPWEDGLPVPLAWDGTHWGTLELAVVSPPMLDLVYRRLDVDGDVVLGPVTVVEPPDAHVADVDAAWNPATGKYGVLWQQIRDSNVDVFFQLLDEATGALVGTATQLDDYHSIVGTYGGSVVADGAGWAVAWTDVEATPDGDLGVSWMRRFDATGTPLGPATRLSDDPVTDSGVPLLARKPGGGFAAFVWCFDVVNEICRLETDAAGNRIGGLTPVSEQDGQRSIGHDVAGNGSDLLVAFSDRATGTSELAAVLVPVADLSTPGPVVPLTSGHDPVGASVGSSSVVPVGAGFAAVWLDSTSGESLMQARTWDGSGGVIATLAPLSPGAVVGRPGVVGIGESFLVAWREAADGGVWLARYQPDGSQLTTPILVSALPSYRSSGVAVAYSGDSFGLLWGRAGGGGLAFRRVALDGTPLGDDVVLAIGNPTDTLPQIAWTGAGWAIVWLEPDNAVHYGLLAADGTPLVLDVPLTAASQRDYLSTTFSLLWTGSDLFLAWSDFTGADPPLDDIYVGRFRRDGSPAFPPVLAVSTPWPDTVPRLYWTHQDAHLHLVHRAGLLVGEREIELLADGTVLGERYWSNRTIGYMAWNGVTLAYMVGVDGNLFFQTGACVTEDAGPPACPPLVVGSHQDLVRLDWQMVGDPAGIVRYHVLRDGVPLAKTWGWTTLFDDPGFVAGATHGYEVRALDAAWKESAGCVPVDYSTTAGDANGDGYYDPADIFYLINVFFADGPPPAGNADANGDDTVDVTDIFYMINDWFGDGPPPLPIASAGRLAQLAAASPGGALAAAADDGKPTPRSTLIVGSAQGAPGKTVRLPVYLVDRQGTPLGPERPFGERVQSVALAVRCAPCGGVASLAVEPAGPLAKLPSLFDQRPQGAGRAALVGAWDELTAPLFAGRSTSFRQPIATVVVRLAPTVPRDARIEVRLDPGTTMLSNQAGTVFETATNRWLELVDGRITLDGGDGSGTP